MTLQNPFFKVVGDNLFPEAALDGYETIAVSNNKKDVGCGCASDTLSTHPDLPSISAIKDLSAHSPRVVEKAKNSSML